jgi:hypothetical protein
MSAHDAPAGLTICLLSTVVPGKGFLQAEAKEREHAFIDLQVRQHTLADSPVRERDREISQSTTEACTDNQPKLAPRNSS